MVDTISQPGCAECGAGGLVLTDNRPYAFIRALLCHLSKGFDLLDLRGRLVAEQLAAHVQVARLDRRHQGDLAVLQPSNRRL